MKDAMKGGVYFLEVTRNPRTGHWHPHLHIIWQGAWIAQPKIRSAWKDITGDSWIVDLRLLHDPKSAVSYVAKYVGKPVPASVWNNPDAVLEYLQAIKGRRVFGAFGSWRQYDLNRNPDESSEWIPVKPLADLISAANDGDESAVFILRRLQNASEKNSIDLERGPPESEEEAATPQTDGEVPF